MKERTIEMIVSKGPAGKASQFPIFIKLLNAALVVINFYAVVVLLLLLFLLFLLLLTDPYSITANCLKAFLAIKSHGADSFPMHMTYDMT